MFCIKCGKTAVANNFCKECFLGSAHLFDLKDFEMHKCHGCGNFKEVSVQGQIEREIKTKNKITSCSVKTKKVGNRLVATVTCSGFVSPLRNTVTEDKKINITIKKFMCKKCIEISGGYYEAVIQVRGDKKDKLMNKLHKMLPQNAVTTVVPLKEGYDVRLRKRGYASTAVSYLRGRFEVKQSYKLVGEKKGKKIYRNFYAIR
ncbi:hypothetical protein HYZ41_04845 [archaeon]|nr:hypothetical protein [archaeon]